MSVHAISMAWRSNCSYRVIDVVVLVTGDFSSQENNPCEGCFQVVKRLARHVGRRFFGSYVALVDGTI